MKTPKLILSICLLAVFSLTGLAQNQLTNSNWCGTDQYMQEKYDQDPALIQQNELWEQYLLDHKDEIRKKANDKQTISFIIPVVWHVVTHNGAGYVSKADIDDQMLTINEDFQRLNADASNTRAQFAPYAADIQVEFRLAHLDPNGNCTEGIVRVESPLAVNADDQVKSVSYWDSKKYFNIWTVISMDGDNPPSIILGYAQFPTVGINSTYGVVMRYNYISRFDRTLSHEIGHCFGLYHTFQGGCSGSCDVAGDRCCDTPPVDQSTQGCNTTQNSCNTDANGPDPWGGVDMEDQIENFMSYDNCQNMFSEDQKTRMHATLNSTNTNTGLNQLTTPSNLALTGTADPYGPVTCAPIAAFSYNKEFLCEGDSVSFTDDSYNGIPTAWNWTFTGGTPSSSSNANPTIQYNTAGVYSVTHEPSTSAGSDVLTKNSIITVSSLVADHIGPVLDGFENTTQFNNEWWLTSGTDANDWENTTAAAATGSRSIRVQNYNVSSSGSDVDYIVSPSYDLSAAVDKTVKFKVAFARKTSADNDRMLVYYSLDCGSSWTLKLPLTTGNLVTAPDQTSVFVPAANEWVEKTMNFAAQGNETNIRFKFQFESGGGNNIYLDDINIGGYVIGIDELEDNFGSFNVYPNPTNSSAQLAFNLNKDIHHLSVQVRDVLGKTVTHVINDQNFNMGKYTLKIDEGRKLPAGVYIVEFNADNQIRTQKLIVQ